MTAKPRKPNGLSFATIGKKRANDKPKGPQKITYWSASRRYDYDQCPFKAKLKCIDKLKEPGNAYMDRGNMMHELCEHYIKGTDTWKQSVERAKRWNDEHKGDKRLKPIDLSDLKDELDRLRALYAKRTRLAATATQPEVEETWAFRSDWSETTWNDWLGCWLRIKLDVGHWEEVKKGKKTLRVFVPTDWKSGRFKEEEHESYLEQLELYALGALVRYPHVDEVRPRLVYVDEGVVYPDPRKPIVYTQADVPRLKELWAKRTKAMLSDTKFAPRPGAYCKYCHFRKSNGGPCRY